MSDYDEELKNLGLKLLHHLDWHGVAMVEFKKDETDNRYKLMEINPKFWGSLELSYRCGINFPYLAYLLAKQEPIPPTTQYQRNVYFRWTFPHDLLWYWHAPIVEKRAFRQLKKKINILNNIHYDDPLTILFNLFFTVFKIFTSKKYPHGKIIQ
jgi:predicted ATP-grasp superfamily ATP-dependent carboligase